jgi:hypothetical protein
MLTRFGQSFNSFENAHNRHLGKRELFAMSGERNPYKEAKLGVFQESPWVDMLLAEAYPTKDINVLKTYERNLLIKEGRLYENMLPNLGRRTMRQKGRSGLDEVNWSALEPRIPYPNAVLRSAFATLTPGRRKSYIFHVSSAKQAKTRAARAEKCVPMILSGRGFNELPN